MFPPASVPAHWQPAQAGQLSGFGVFIDIWSWLYVHTFLLFVVVL
jgi:hypothetical protein